MQIAYKLEGSFEDIGKNDRIGFEIVFPQIYMTYEAAENNQENICAFLEKQGNEVVLRLYENHCHAETIHWDQWYKYKCFRIKAESRDLCFVDVLHDYAPCADKFEEIFEKLCSDSNIFRLQYLAYRVVPVILEETEKVHI